MRIETGHHITRDVSIVDASSVVFVTEDGRRMLEVSIGSDGASVEVRAPDTCFINGVLHGTQLVISPKVSNQVSISTAEYDAKG